MHDAVEEEDASLVNVSLVNVALGIDGFSFADLYEPLRLRDLHEAFWRFAEARKMGAIGRFAAVKNGSLKKPQASEVLIEVAGLVGEFLARLLQSEALWR